MIEFFSNLSLFLGFILKTSAEIFVIILVMLGIAYLIEKYTLPSACTGNCNQGRNCNCKGK